MTEDLRAKYEAAARERDALQKELSETLEGLEHSRREILNAQQRATEAMRHADRDAAIRLGGVYDGLWYAQRFFWDAERASRDLQDVLSEVNSTP